MMIYGLLIAAISLAFWLGYYRSRSEIHTSVTKKSGVIVQREGQRVSIIIDGESAPCPSCRNCAVGKTTLTFWGANLTELGDIIRRAKDAE